MPSLKAPQLFAAKENPHYPFWAFISTKNPPFSNIIFKRSKVHALSAALFPYFPLSAWVLTANHVRLDPAAQERAVYRYQRSTAQNAPILAIVLHKKPPNFEDSSFIWDRWQSQVGAGAVIAVMCHSLVHISLIANCLFLTTDLWYFSTLFSFNFTLSVFY